MLRTVQLVKHGPEIPIEVLQAQEDGNLILFCGAGVSKPAGLPNFAELVDQIYKELHDKPAPDEDRALSNHEYDRVLHLLELRYQDQGLVRSALRNILDLSDAKMLATHRWLLKLAKAKSGDTRIITTNFDRGFALTKSDDIEIDAAPKLSIPKKEKWNSIVHLHGLLGEDSARDNELVLTSADFGAAYLMDRWASRFVSELFRNFAILFIGYGVNDPVIRYMMDAYSAEKKYYPKNLGVYVLTENKKNTADLWKSMGIQPIFYASSPSHMHLHRTIKAWAELHSIGLQGKENIIRSYAKYPPAHRGSETVGQVVWALKERSGHIANVFANNDPSPPVEWLQVLHNEGLLSTNVCVAGEDRSNPIVDSGQITGCPLPLSKITTQLSAWITLHLDRLEVVDYIIEHGLCLHPEFKGQIRRAIHNKVIKDPYRPLWEYWSSRIYSCDCDNVFTGYRSLKPANQEDQWTIEKIGRALKYLEPKIKIGKSWHRLEGEILGEPLQDGSISKLVDVDLVLNGGNPTNYFRDFSTWPVHIIADLVEGISESLYSGWRLLQMFGEVDNLNDLSYISQPSIEPHPQNKRFREWCYLVEYLRDAWIVISEHRPKLASLLLAKWMSIKFPIYRRLSLYALAKSDLLKSNEKVDYLLEKGGWWLFSVETQREKFRLINSLLGHLSRPQLNRVLRAILDGPPREMFISDLEEEEWVSIKERSVWLLLKKMEVMGFTLTLEASKELRRISQRHGEWKLSEDDRDEFPSWSSSGFGYPSEYSVDTLRNLSVAEIIKILKSTEHNRRGLLSAWRAFARVEKLKTFEILDQIKIANMDWIIETWEYALGGFDYEKIPKYFIKKVRQRVDSANPEVVSRLAGALSWFIDDVSKIILLEPKSEILKLWDITINHTQVDYDNTVDDFVSKALNHAQGRLCEALLRSIWNSIEKTGGNIPEWLLDRITMLTSKNEFYLARVILASRIFDLYKLNSEWVINTFIEKFYPSRNSESTALWEGYLWTARWSPDFFDELKLPFLDLLSQSTPRLKRIGTVYELFGVLCVEHPGAFTSDEKRNILRSAGKTYLATISNTLNRQLYSVDSGTDRIWSERIAPFIRDHWPNDASFKSEEITINFVMMVLTLDQEFPQAVTLIQGYLIRVKYIGHIAPRMGDWFQAGKYPKLMLRLLRKIINPGTTVAWTELRDILNKIEYSRQSLVNSSEYRFIDEWLRENNIQ